MRSSMYCPLRQGLESDLNAELIEVDVRNGMTLFGSDPFDGLVEIVRLGNKIESCLLGYVGHVTDPLFCNEVGITEEWAVSP